MTIHYDDLSARLSRNGIRLEEVKEKHLFFEGRTIERQKLIYDVLQELKRQQPKN